MCDVSDLPEITEGVITEMTGVTALRLFIFLEILFFRSLMNYPASASVVLYTP
jgi:hypothetical protein